MQFQHRQGDDYIANSTAFRRTWPMPTSLESRRRFLTHMYERSPLRFSQYEPISKIDLRGQVVQD